MKNKNIFIQQAAMFIALLVVTSQIAIPAGGVSFTLQTLSIIVIALTSSMLMTFTTISIYLLMGMVGLPVFANGSSGIGVFSTLSGGFLIGFVFAGTALSIVKFKRLEFTLLSGIGFTIVLYIFGVLGAMMFHKMSFEDTITWLVKPYVIFDLLKLACAMYIADRINQSNILKTNYNKMSALKVTIK